MIADDVAIAAAGAGDERGPVVIGLLGDIVVGAVAARFAGERELVIGVSRLGSLALAARDVGVLPRRDGF